MLMVKILNFTDVNETMKTLKWSLRNEMLRV